MSDAVDSHRDNSKATGKDNGGYEDDEDGIEVIPCEDENLGGMRDHRVEVTVLRKNDDPYAFYKCFEIKPITKHLPNFINQAKRALKASLNYFKTSKFSQTFSISPFICFAFGNSGII